VPSNPRQNLENYPTFLIFENAREILLGRCRALPMGKKSCADLGFDLGSLPIAIFPKFSQIGSDLIANRRWCDWGITVTGDKIIKIGRKSYKRILS
jgi:hypothetical protein